MRLAAACLLFMTVVVILRSALLDWHLHQYERLQTCAAPLEQQH